MKIPFFLLFILLTFISGYTAETEEKDYMFSEGYLGLEGGDAYPWGTTEDAIQPALFGQGNFTYRYWKNTYGIVQFGYAYFKTYTEFKRFPGVHQFHGRVGLEHQFSCYALFFSERVLVVFGLVPMEAIKKTKALA